MRTPPNERLTSDIAEPSLSAAAGSERRCVLSGDTSARDGLVRLAISPDGLVLPDAGAKAPGRGAWIGVTRSALEAALADGSLRKALMRAFKGAPLTIPEDLPAKVEAALVRHLGDRLGLELRSGNIVMGSARIEEQARSGRIAVLLHASDSSADGRRKLDQAWRVGTDAEGSGLTGQTLPLDRTALSVALGRDNVVHLVWSTWALPVIPATCARQIACFRRCPGWCITPAMIGRAQRMKAAGTLPATLTSLRAGQRPWMNT